MKPRLLIKIGFAIFTASLCSASISAAELVDLAAKPAVIEASEMTEVPLRLSDAKKGWIEIPEALTRYHATIFRPDRDQLGVTEFQVMADGFVLLACNFEYQGNSSGDWQEEALGKRELKRLGWKEIRKSAIGGDLIQTDKRVQVLFYKNVRKGEHYELRCNKYDPPYPILLHRVVVAEAE